MVKNDPKLKIEKSSRHPRVYLDLYSNLDLDLSKLLVSPAQKVQCRDWVYI